MDIIKFIEENWQQGKGTSATIKSGRKCRELVISSSNKWDAWLWSCRAKQDGKKDLKERVDARENPDFFRDWEIKTPA